MAVTPVTAIQDERPHVFSFQMPFYREHLHATQFVQYAGAEQLQEASRLLLRLMSGNLRAAPLGVLSPGWSRSLVEQLQDRPSIPGVARFTLWAREHDVWGALIPSGPAYHGDLTWGNVLWSLDPGATPHQLIDYTDAPWETPLIDAAKLLMDCALRWTFRLQGEVPSPTTEVLCDQLHEQLLAQLSPDERRVARVLQYHYTLRLFPYNPTHEDFLSHEILRLFP
jgi:hypothetical protein